MAVSWSTPGRVERLEAGGQGDGGGLRVGAGFLPVGHPADPYVPVRFGGDDAGQPVPGGGQVGQAARTRIHR
jgi:hypothetical protein